MTCTTIVSDLAMPLYSRRGPVRSCAQQFGSTVPYRSHADHYCSRILSASLDSEASFCGFRGLDSVCRLNKQEVSTYLFDHLVVWTTTLRSRHALTTSIVNQWPCGSAVAPRKEPSATRLPGFSRPLMTGPVVWLGVVMRMLADMRRDILRVAIRHARREMAAVQLGLLQQ